MCYSRLQLSKCIYIHLFNRLQPHLCLQFLKIWKCVEWGGKKKSRKEKKGNLDFIFLFEFVRWKYMKRWRKFFFSCCLFEMMKEMERSKVFNRLKYLNFTFSILHLGYLIPLVSNFPRQKWIESNREKLSTGLYCFLPLFTPILNTQIHGFRSFLFLSLVFPLPNTANLKRKPYCSLLYKNKQQPIHFTS